MPSTPVCGSVAEARAVALAGRLVVHPRVAQRSVGPSAARDEDVVLELVELCPQRDGEGVERPGEVGDLHGARPWQLDATAEEAAFRWQRVHDQGGRGTPANVKTLPLLSRRSAPRGD